MSDISQLDAFSQQLMHLANVRLPVESKKFLRKECSKLVPVARRVARSEIKKISGNYLAGFKAGKPYMFNGALSCRTFNAAPHAHLIEYGHRNVVNGRERGFTPGKKILEKAAERNKNKFYENCENFISEVLGNGSL